jgi:ketosteroid isomerase-like protein
MAQAEGRSLAKQSDWSGEMSGLSREDYVKLVETDYFGSVMKRDFDAVVACFTDDATVTIYHGDAEPRIFKAAPGPGETPLRAFFEHLLANYDPMFDEFVHFVDAAGERCAATFAVRLTPKPESAYQDYGVQHLRNCNFFQCRDGRIHDMIIYYANPAIGGAGEPTEAKPTGFPKGA